MRLSLNLVEVIIFHKLKKKILMVKLFTSNREQSENNFIVKVCFIQYLQYKKRIGIKIKITNLVLTFQNNA